MDIIAIRQSDDTYKISPFRIRFGSFKVFKTKEKIVNILINGQKVDLTMRLSENGEAYFMNEIKKVVEDLNYMSDCYSPVETLNSAPNSPKMKSNEIKFPQIGQMENVKIIIKDKEIVEEQEEIKLETTQYQPEVSINLIQREIKEEEINLTLNDRIGEQLMEQTNDQIMDQTNDQIIEQINKQISDQITENGYSFNDSSIFIDQSEIEVKRNRKMSYDVLSRDEKYYKFRPVRNESFSINTRNSKSNMKIDLSNSWSLLSKGKDKLEEIFYNNKISKEEFFRDPWKVLNNNNLSIRYEDHIYTWKVIAPIIVSNLAFNEDLPSDIIAQLTQQQEGFFLWKRVNMDAFKIDINRKLGENIINNTPKKEELIKSKFIEDEVNSKLEKINSCSTDTSPPMKIIERRQTIQYKKTYTLSSDQIKALNLKKGKNEISFVVSSRYQGTHILTSDLYLWDCEDKILISDLDGTITRSDVLGHVLPYIGRDWSHKGVVKLFNEIDRHGYKIIYLTARSISQSDQTKNYLRNKLSQNGVKLPLGPILMSPDGIISSFKREVIDRTPQAFKIDCLTHIVNLFPSDAQPFYAGFGNRHTDAISYEAVGISRNKIFIINEKGEISQYNQFYRTSYVNINEMVNEMFPPLHSNNTYFGTLNYFKPTYGNLNIKSVFN